MKLTQSVKAVLPGAAQQLQRIAAKHPDAKLVVKGTELCVTPSGQHKIVGIPINTPNLVKRVKGILA